MKCPRCQAENDAGARFCEDCGARLEAACPSYGTAITPGKKFCRSCGAALTPEPSKGDVQKAIAVLERGYDMCRTAQPEQAREGLTTATTMYREIDMRYWLEKAEAELHNLA